MTRYLAVKRGGGKRGEGNERGEVISVHTWSYKLYVTCCVSAYDEVSRRQVYILEAVGLFSGSVGVWLHHMPYIPFTAGLIAAIASQSPDVMLVSIICVSMLHMKVH